MNPQFINTDESIASVDNNHKINHNYYAFEITTAFSFKYFDH